MQNAVIWIYKAVCIVWWKREQYYRAESKRWPNCRAASNRNHAAKGDVNCSEWGPKIDKKNDRILNYKCQEWKAKSNDDVRRRRVTAKRHEKHKQKRSLCSNVVCPRVWRRIHPIRWFKTIKMSFWEINRRPSESQYTPVDCQIWRHFVLSFFVVTQDRKASKTYPYMIDTDSSWKIS